MGWDDDARLAGRVAMLLTMTLDVGALSWHDRIALEGVVREAIRMTKEFAGEPEAMGAAVARTWAFRAAEFVQAIAAIQYHTIEGAAVKSCAIQAAAIVNDLAIGLGAEADGVLPRFGFDRVGDDSWLSRAAGQSSPQSIPTAMVEFLELRARQMGVSDEQIAIASRFSPMAN